MSIHPQERGGYTRCMQSLNHENNLCRLFEEYYGTPPTVIQFMHQHASDRKYYRLESERAICVGTYSCDREVNKSFQTIAQLLDTAMIPAARIIHTDTSGEYYLQEYLGPHNGLEYIAKRPDERGYVLRKALERAADMHYRVVWPSDRSMQYACARIAADCNQFSNEFIRMFFVNSLPGLQSELENVVKLFTALPESIYTFTHRDYQLRNLIVSDQDLSVVDFQSAFYAPGIYDVASLLFSSSLHLSSQEINEYINYYNDYTKQNYTITNDSIVEQVYIVALCRSLQALGAYGRAVFRNNKKQFLESIPKALKNLNHIICVVESQQAMQFPILRSITERDILALKNIKNIPIELSSFSYGTHQQPVLNERNLNYLFDARIFHNPGRDKALNMLTGTDTCVKDYLVQYPEYLNFVEAITQTVKSTLQSTYLYSAPIDKIAIYIGCTGGKHRSVATVELVAEQLAATTSNTIIKKHLNL